EDRRATSAGGSRRRQGEKKRRAPARLRFHPDPAAMAFDDFLADRQADAGAGIFLAAVQPLEDQEDALKILRSDANPIIPHAEFPFCSRALHSNMDFWPLLASELHSVPEQILEQLSELHFVAGHGRQTVVGDFRPGFLDRHAK